MQNRSAVFAVCVGAAFCLVIPGSTLAEPTSGLYGQYTSTADFAQGEKISLKAGDVDQLSIDDTSSSFNFMWVAKSVAGTVIKINTSTGQVVGEYRTHPSGLQGNPSRTTVDNNGNVWVGNRNESGSVAAGAIHDGTGTFPRTPASTRNMGSVVHVRLAETGSCVDRNNNGVIDTSTGLGDVRAWSNAGGADTHGGTSTAEDECIIHYVRTNSDGVRHVTVNGDNNVWVGGFKNDGDAIYFNTGAYDLIDGELGAIIRAESSLGNPNIGGYGGIIDSNGVLWSGNRHTVSGRLLRWDTRLPLSGPSGANWSALGSVRTYGVCIDRTTGNVFTTERYDGHVAKYSPSGVQLARYPIPTGASQGCVVTDSGDVWVAQDNVNQVVHMKTDGTVIGTIATGPGPSGVAVDAEGKVWVTCRYDCNNATYGNQENCGAVLQIDPEQGPVGGDGVTKVGAVIYSTGRVGRQLYNYSDMTGATNTGAPEVGSWTVEHDAGAAGAGWHRVSWNAEVPSGGDLSVFVTSSDVSGSYNSLGEVMAGNGVPFDIADGRYLRVRVQFSRSTSIAPSPVLYDLSVQAKDCECRIGDACHAEGGFNPDNGCETCRSDSAVGAWTKQSLGTTCDDGDPCTYEDACSAFAECGGIQSVCDDGEFCTRDICNGDGTCTFTLDNTQGGDTDTTCDGQDDDCNGEIDDGWRPDTLTCGTGVCSRNKVTTCIDGEEDDTCVPGAPLAQTDVTCDGQDDDCDGTDDDDWVPVTLTCGDGVCRVSKTTTCGPGGQHDDTCTPNSPTAQTDGTCDGLDNDCDGVTDDDYAPRTVTCGTGVCERSRTTVCVNGAEDAACVAGSPISQADATCNNADDNCDGSTDEDATPIPTSCGVGACASTGLLTCGMGGIQSNSCVAGQPTTDVCDGDDNDCDGSTDNDRVTGASVCSAIETQITSGPDAVTAQTSATFTYQDPSDPSATLFECSLDGGPWLPCSNGSKSYSNLSVGSHSFLVRAIGADGTRDATPDFYAWEISSAEPDTTLLIAPSDPSQSNQATFLFGCSVDNATFQCALDPGGTPDGDDYAPCTALSTFQVEDGPHALWVFCRAPNGNVDPLPAMHTWTVDTTLPDTVIVRGPAAVTAATSAELVFGDPGDADLDTFLCRLDDGDWEACGTATDNAGEYARGYVNLTPGEHIFAVAAVDAGGNQDPTPATHRWRVDDAPPETFILVSPANPSQSGEAIFGFGSNESDVAYRCILDPGTASPAAGTYLTCGSTEQFTGLADGEHVLYVFAVDTAGNRDTSPAVHTWTIDQTFPETEIVAGPPTLTGPEDGAVFAYRDPTDLNVMSFQCSLDGGAFVACDGGTIAYDAASLAVGTHRFQVRTCQQSPAQCDPTPAEREWEVTTSPCPLDVTAPVLSCDADQTIECSGGGAATDVLAFVPSATDACGPVEVDYVGPETFQIGTTPLVFVAEDGNGNTSTCITLVTVEDTAPPTIGCPQDVTLSTSEFSCTATATLNAATVDDTCFGSGIIAFSDAPPVFPFGETVVTHSAIDGVGKMATCTQMVTVVDDVPLAITCEASIRQEAGADACSWAGSLTATATDNCAVEATVLTAANTYPVGSQAVTFSAADVAGNTGTCETTVEVVDVTDPSVTCGTLVGDAPGVVRPVASDACGAVVTIEGVVCELTDGDGTRALAAADCPVKVSDGTLEISGRVAGGLVVKYAARATDPSGNTVTEACELAFDGDSDKDGVVDAIDNCPFVGDTSQTDSDEDGVGDVCDLCPEIADADQVDSDDNGIGDACQDTDGDGFIDDDDNCPTVANPDQIDSDTDGIGNSCDETVGVVAGGAGGCQSGEATFPLLLILLLGGLMWWRRERSLWL